MLPVRLRPSPPQPIGPPVYTSLRPALTAVLLLLLASLAPAQIAPAAPAATGPATAPGRPRVLLIGDSISLGYTPVVQSLLKGQVEVVHPPGNCQHSAVGVSRIHAWLGTQRWDVIHFNFGIWDTHMLNKASGALVRNESQVPAGDMRIRHTPEQYRENLTEIVKVLRGTGAKLIWASTTPVTSRKGERFEDIARLNAIAAQVMKENGIPVNDLYAFTLPQASQWQHDGCHFKGPANQLIGAQVGRAVCKALGLPEPTAASAPAPPPAASQPAAAGVGAAPAMK